MLFEVENGYERKASALRRFSFRITVQSEPKCRVCNIALTLRRTTLYFITEARTQCNNRSPAIRSKQLPHWCSAISERNMFQYQRLRRECHISIGSNLSCATVACRSPTKVQSVSDSTNKAYITTYSARRYGVLATLLLLMLLPRASLARDLPFGGTDFKQYYTTSKQILDGKNPYDYSDAERIQRQLGSEGEAQVPYGPPTSLLPFIPLGWLDYHDAVQVQLILNCLMMIFSAFLWGMMLYPRYTYAPFAAIAVVAAWLPCISLVGMGHVTSWTLFGFTLWCFAQNKQQPLAAGVVLALSIIKPHLAFGLVIFAGVYGLRHRQWKMLGAFVATVLCLLVLTWIIRPTIWHEYLASLPQSNPTQWYNATLDGFGRMHFGDGFRLVSLAFMVLVLGWIALLAWTRDVFAGPLVCALWLVGTPYAFNYDFILLIPAIVMVCLSWNRHHPWWCIFLLAGWIVLDVLFIRQKGIWKEYQFFVIPWGGLMLAMLTEKVATGLSGARVHPREAPQA
jgi:hypothetical protein